MKKLSLFFAMMMAVVVWAQMPTIQFGETSKDLNHASMFHANVIAQTDEGVLAVVPHTRTIMKNSVISGRYFLRMIGKSGQTLREVVLPGTEKTQVFGEIIPLEFTATLADGKAYLAYLVDGKLLRTVIDPATMQVISSDPMADIEVSDIMHLSRSYSPNRDFIAMTVASQNYAQVLLLDETLQPLWVKSTNILGWVYADNQGNVYLASTNVNDNGTRLSLNMHTADGQLVEESATFPQAMDVKFLNADNGVVVAMGVVACDVQSDKDRFVTFDRIAGIAYDFTSRQAKINLENITSDELNVFANLSTKKPNKVGKADGLTVRRTLVTSFGGVALIDRCWSVTHHDGSMTYTDHYSQGTLVMAVDKEGRILWHRPFRIFIKENPSNRMTSTPQLFEQGDNIYFLRVDTYGIPSYDITNPAKRFNPGAKHSKHSLYCIDRQGNVTKNLLNLDGCTFCTPIRTSPTSFFLFQGVYRGGFATIQF